MKLKYSWDVYYPDTLAWQVYYDFFGMCKNLRVFRADYMASIKLRNLIHAKSSAI